MQLGDLGDPDRYHEPIAIEGRDPALLVSHLRSMIRIRMAEEHLAAKRREALIGGPVHLGIGQEAIAVGVSHSLRETDAVFGSHRSHPHILALGASVHRLFAEVLGKETGFSRGMGGSMHLWDRGVGFHGSVPIVAGTVPLAVGAALAARLKRSDTIAVSYFGDGACEEGAVQESLNLASVLELPIVFVVENNLFSSHMHISLRQPYDATARFAVAHGIDREVVDGNDVVAVTDAAARLIDGARSGRGPGFLEAVTFRWLGHVDWREDVDVGVERSAEDLARWRRRDPIGRLEAALAQAGHWSADEAERYRAGLGAELAVTWERAMGDPWPDEEALLGRVYAADGRAGA
jgi:pyruvate dehydrogenase E1 component alpha subunit